MLETADRAKESLQPTEFSSTRKSSCSALEFPRQSYNLLDERASGHSTGPFSAGNLDCLLRRPLRTNAKRHFRVALTAIPTIGSPKAAICCAHYATAQASTIAIPVWLAIHNALRAMTRRTSLHR